MAVVEPFVGRSATAPLIAVSTSEVRDAGATTPVAHGDPRRTEMALGMTYVKALRAGGAVPVVLPPLDDAALDACLDRVDGVCLSGGPDLDPAQYAGAPHPELGPVEPALDAFELALVRAADARGLPLLAICRGLQVLNVARGGTLHQHLPDVTDGSIGHRQAGRGDERTHRVTLRPGSRLADLLGAGEVAVNSFHHQAAAAIGTGLEPVGHAEDGTVEALEQPGERWVVAVQWHAECLVGDARHRSLFAAFAAAARLPRPALSADLLAS